MKFGMLQRRKLKIALVWTGIVLLCSNGPALNAKSNFFPYHVNYITNDIGLPQNTVNDILLDSYGFVWFGTGNGLARYDGYSFNIYGKERLPSNLINSLDVT
jgi:ligand-binding sensor domain-containing protein